MGDEDDDVVGIALRVAHAIEAVGGEYFIGGSLASSLQGEPRATNDVDFVLALSIGSIPPFRACLGPDFELDADMLRDALLHARTANAFYLPRVTKIDFFGRGQEPFDESEFSRRAPVRVRATGETLIVKMPEDTVLRKLLWYRDGGSVSERQWRDVVSVLRVSGTRMDQHYLEQWAAKLGLSALLERARGSTPPRP
jgi:hypothetical protein